jgi:hypothetical protein
VKKSLIIAALALFASACMNTQAVKVAEPTPENAAKAIAAAEFANGKAAAVNYEWRDTGKMIADAKKAAQAKEYAKAIALALQAQRQGNNAVKQQAAQADAASRF